MEQQKTQWIRSLQENTPLDIDNKEMLVFLAPLLGEPEFQQIDLAQQQKLFPEFTDFYQIQDRGTKERMLLVELNMYLYFGSDAINSQDEEMAIEWMREVEYMPFAQREYHMVFDYLMSFTKGLDKPNLLNHKARLLCKMYEYAKFDEYESEQMGYVPLTMTQTQKKIAERIQRMLLTESGSLAHEERLDYIKYIVSTMSSYSGRNFIHDDLFKTCYLIVKQLLQDGTVSELGLLWYIYSIYPDLDEREWLRKYILTSYSPDQLCYRLENFGEVIICK